MAWLSPYIQSRLDPVKPVDAVVYLDESGYAVAVDRKGRQIARSTDHASVIQAAIDEIGGRIVIGPGTYILEARKLVTGSIYTAILVNKSVELIGSGMGKTVLKLGDNLQANIITVYGARYVRIASMTLDGNKANNTDSGVDGNQTGIWSGGERYYEIYEDLEIKNAVREGIYIGYFQGTSRGAFLRNIIAHDNGLSGIVLDRPLYLDAYRLYAFNNGKYGVYISTTNLLPFESHVSGIFTYDNADIGVHVRNVEGLVLSGIRSINNGVTSANTAAHGVLISGSKNIIAEGVYVKGNYGVGFYIFNSTHVVASVVAEQNNNIGVRLYDAKHCVVRASTRANVGAALAEQNLSDYNVLTVAWEADGAAPSKVGVNTLLTSVGA